MLRAFVICVLLAILLSTLMSGARGHGRLKEPPGRASMWRYGFETTPNYNDAQLWCGGREMQWGKNGGKCGICGDNWADPVPREHEDGGKYGLKIVVRTYNQGQVIPVEVELTVHHKGYFEFRLCPMTQPDQVADQDCLDRYPLQLANETTTQYQLPKGSTAGIYKFELKLPKDLTCERCVFQWHYRAGNHWDFCGDGIGALGCGPQEYFRGCADVTILPPA